MYKILLFLVSLVIYSPALAAISCPSGMILTQSSAAPVGDCVCLSGQRPRMTLTAPSLAFGVCPNVQVFSAQTGTGLVQTFTVPQSGIYTIQAWGGQGGQSKTTLTGGKGALAQGNFSLVAGNVLKIFVGQQGQNDPFTNAAGGGGGTFVLSGAADDTTFTAYLVAGGGGGGGTANGGQGLNATAPGTGGTAAASSSGAGFNNIAGTIPGGTGLFSGVISNSGIANGGLKTTACGLGGGNGGFGGGGGGNCTSLQAGSGGGYTGGTTGSTAGGGGTSFISNVATNISSSSGVQTGPGQVIISW